MHAASASEHVQWKKSSASAQTDCVEVARVDGSMLVRDSKDQAGPRLAFTLSEWRAFLAGVRLGEFDQD
jgi:hypothetical protein